ncbi:nicotianamine synthase-like [Punica granatum]|uniref:Nicotianamine synthase-like n=2 Tax=Punica granatum TaxID=22663 RepID=A0A6P8EGU4_PUNGR|nr:nicotianamine synthase-like [Punica granatum]PKI32022.1 hypothetical protein CRG98_047585 [Punica granatum]
MVCQEDPLIRTICELHAKISSLETLSPCKDVNNLFTQLVLTCIPPHPIEVDSLCSKVQEIRSDLIRLCGEAEGLLESHFSSLLASFDHPLDHLHLFPYYNNYLKLARLEFDLLSQHLTCGAPARVAFVGSGPLPLTTLVLAANHLNDTVFHNYDIDPSANSKALRLVLPDPDLSKRVLFHTDDIMNVTTALGDYDVVFLAALVGMAEEEKVRVIAHLANHMAPGAILVVRSAHGARAFLYPVIDPSDLRGFEFLSVFHPTDDVINSVIIARKYMNLNDSIPIVHDIVTTMKKKLPLATKKCCEIQPFLDPLNPCGNIAEDLAIEEKSS